MTPEGIKAFHENRVVWVSIWTRILYEMLLGDGWYRLITNLPKSAEPTTTFHYEWTERKFYIMFASPEFEVVEEGNKAPVINDCIIELASVQLDTSKFPPVVTFNRGGVDIMGLPHVQIVDASIPPARNAPWPWYKAGTRPGPQNGPNESPKP